MSKASARSFEPGKHVCLLLWYMAPNRVKKKIKKTTLNNKLLSTVFSPWSYIIICRTYENRLSLFRTGRRRDLREKSHRENRRHSFPSTPRALSVFFHPTHPLTHSPTRPSVTTAPGEIRSDGHRNNVSLNDGNAPPRSQSFAAAAFILHVIRDIIYSCQRACV